MLYNLLIADTEGYPMLPLVTPFEHNFWCDGKPILEAVPLLRFDCTPQAGEPVSWWDYLMPAVHIPLVSKRMREVLTRAGADNIQYFPAEVLDPSTKTPRTYYAMNIVGLCSCVDRKRSVFTPAEGHELLITDFERLVLTSDFIPSRIFRLAEQGVLAIVDETVRQSAEAAGLTGVRFVLPENLDYFDF